VLTQFQKDFYEEHPEVKKFAEVDVLAFRKKHEITVHPSYGAPKPIRTFDQASFPGLFVYMCVFFVVCVCVCVCVCVYLSLSLCLFVSLSLSLTHTHTRSLSLSLSLSISLFSHHTHMFTHTHTHTHTYTHTHTHIRLHPQRNSESRFHRTDTHSESRLASRLKR